MSATRRAVRRWNGITRIEYECITTFSVSSRGGRFCSRGSSSSVCRAGKGCRPSSCISACHAGSHCSTRTCVSTCHAGRGCRPRSRVSPCHVGRGCSPRTCVSAFHAGKGCTSRSRFSSYRASIFLPMPWSSRDHHPSRIPRSGLSPPRATKCDATSDDSFPRPKTSERSPQFWQFSNLQTDFSVRCALGQSRVAISD